MNRPSLRIPAGYAVPVLFIFLICMVMISGCGQKPGVADSTPLNNTVAVSTGLLQGSTENGIQVFRGIPYAAPPMGELRWRSPAPARSWNGTRNATEYGPICPQVISDNATPGTSPPPMSEDCLYLNIWSPRESSQRKLPVMVFIHGGAFMEGAGSLPLYDGSALAKKGVLVVTLNYRLGPLGFLAHPDLDNESATNTSGNYGLMDQQEALRWVQANIGAFGGDPARVTVFGESAGASSILAQLSSPHAQGLFSQAIVESGPLWTNGSMISIISTNSEAERNGIGLAHSLGADGPGAIRTMRGMDAMTILAATPRSPSAFRTVNTLRFRPSVDGYILPVSPEETFRQGRQMPVPLIVGTNADEGTTLAAGTGMNVSAYEQYIHGRFGPYARDVLAAYPASTPDEVQYQMERIMNDLDFAEAATFIAGSQAAKNPGTYLYRFSYEMPGQPLGSFHGSELYFVFRPASMNPDPVSSRVSDTMMTLWTTFAMSGNPDGRSVNTTWPRYTAAGKQYLDIGAEPVVKTG